MEENELDKSEAASPFKLNRAREKGSVARGIDLGFFAGILALLGYAWVSGTTAVVEISRLASLTFRSAAFGEGGSQVLTSLISTLFSAIIPTILVFAGTVFAVTLLFEFLQVGPVFSAQTLKPDFKRINPVEGLKRIFSLKMLIEAFKSVIKLAVYGVIAWLVIAAALRVTVYSATDAGRLLAAMGNAGFRLLAYCAIAAFFIAMLDQVWSRRDFAKKMRMSRRELRREHRDREGDPRLKQKRREFHKSFLDMAKSLRGVRDADVILINPTRFAVALRYDSQTMLAPKLVSRGSGALASRIRELGFLYGVTIHRSPELARLLFRTAQLDIEIPDALYEQVADVYRRHGLSKNKTAEKGA